MLFVERAARSFGSLDVLHDVDLDVSNGERASLVEPQVAGKSTILRLIAGDDAPARRLSSPPSDILGSSISVLPDTLCSRTPLSIMEPPDSPWRRCDCG